MINPNKLYGDFLRFYLKKRREGVIEAIELCNEGAQRSGKTYGAFDIIYTFCECNPNAGLRINMFRLVLKDSREILYGTDFVKWAKINEINYTVRDSNNTPKVNLNGNILVFRGLNDSEPSDNDINYFNEAIEIDDEGMVSGWTTRSRLFNIFDWNPKLTIHWLFKHEGRENTMFTRTTWKDNKHMPMAVVANLEKKSPWLIEDLHLPKDKRRPHLENIAAGTVDEWYFEVYYMGIRANRDGLVFPNVTWVEEMTKDTDKYLYGLDFGNTTGIFAFAQIAKNQHGYWYDCPIYGSFANQSQIENDSMSGLKNFWEHLKKWILKNNYKEITILVICDSAVTYWQDLNQFAANDGFLKISFFPVKKYPGCVEKRIDQMKRDKMNVVKRECTKKEQENYCYDIRQGVNFGAKKNGFDHFFDAAGYARQYYEI